MGPQGVGKGQDLCLFVLGHSWGSLLGLQLAKRRPEWLHAYIGVAQLIDGPENELEAIAPTPLLARSTPSRTSTSSAKWVGFYGGVMAYRRDNSADSALARLSPDYSDQEIRRIREGNEFATPYLLPELVTLDLTTNRKLAVPLILFEGCHDWNVKFRARRRVV